ncbi:unnamed protein product [Linum tenue]|uniref:Uncharacterized protein n=1 Tax=Linum tenue TaxID=586396 RepID=A0AAV0QR35_9ROSI|nr:unnamed protein product [Linum tenue]
MAMTTINHEIKSSNISAQKMFKAVVQESNTTYMTVFPQLIKTIETIQGDGGPETILRFYFIDSGKHFPLCVFISSQLFLCGSRNRRNEKSKK